MPHPPFLNAIIQLPHYIYQSNTVHKIFNILLLFCRSLMLRLFLLSQELIHDYLKMKKEHTCSTNNLLEDGHI